MGNQNWKNFCFLKNKIKTQFTRFWPLNEKFISSNFIFQKFFALGFLDIWFLGAVFYLENCRYKKLGADWLRGDHHLERFWSIFFRTVLKTLVHFSCNSWNILLKNIFYFYLFSIIFYLWIFLIKFTFKKIKNVKVKSSNFYIK